jgi:hypothetical protein
MAIVICHLRPHGNVALFPTFDFNSGFSHRPPRRPRRAAAAPVRGRLAGRAALQPARRAAAAPGPLRPLPRRYAAASTAAQRCGRAGEKGSWRAATVAAQTQP